MFGFDQLERKVYVFLVRRGWSTALTISRGSGVKRTTLYRVLQRLEEKGLIKTQLTEKTTFYGATDPKLFEGEVVRKEAEAAKMRKALADLSGQLGAMSQLKGGETGVKFYRGVRGLQAMEWRMCEKRNVEVILFGGGMWDAFLGSEFAEEIRTEMVKQQTRLRELINSGRSEQSSKVADSGKVPWTTNQAFVTHCFRHRVVPADVMQITQDLKVFESSIHLGSYRDDEVMGIAVESQEYARMLKQLFEVVWGLAKTIDDFGGGWD